MVVEVVVVVVVVVVAVIVVLPSWHWSVGGGAAERPFW